MLILIRLVINKTKRIPITAKQFLIPAVILFGAIIYFITIFYFDLLINQVYYLCHYLVLFGLVIITLILFRKFSTIKINSLVISVFIILFLIFVSLFILKYYKTQQEITTWNGSLGGCDEFNWL